VTPAPAYQYFGVPGRRILGQWFLDVSNGGFGKLMSVEIFQKLKNR